MIARAVDTDGTIGMWEVWAKPGMGPPWHTHRRETEIFRIISGTFRFWCGQDSFDVGPGATVTLPPNVAHQWKNVGADTGQVLAIVAPGGFEEQFLDIARMPLVSREAIVALDEKYGIIDGYPGGSPPV